jgi:FAD/FMN-containing dehydrogenase
MRRVLIVLGVAALVALAGCSSGKKSDTSTATTAVTVPPSQPPPSFTGEGSQEFCDLLRSNVTRLQQAASAIGSDPEQAKQLLRDSAPAVRQAAAVAPAEIKADATVLADGYDRLVATLDQGTPDYSALLQLQASQNLVVYARDVCKITV